MQKVRKRPTFEMKVGLFCGDKQDRTAVVCLPERLSKSQEKQKTNLSVGLGGDKRDRTADLLNAIFGEEMESVGIWWNLEDSGAI